MLVEVSSLRLVVKKRSRVENIHWQASG
jgi:hypothetical protein